MARDVHEKAEDTSSSEDVSSSEDLAPHDDVLEDSESQGSLAAGGSPSSEDEEDQKVKQQAKSQQPTSEHQWEACGGGTRAVHGGEDDQGSVLPMGGTRASRAALKGPAVINQQVRSLMCTSGYTPRGACEQKVTP